MKTRKIVAISLVLLILAIPVFAIFNQYDVNQDGKVNSKDITRLMKYVASGGEEAEPKPVEEELEILPTNYIETVINDTRVYSYSGKLYYSPDHENSVSMENESQKGRVYHIKLSESKARTYGYHDYDGILDFTGYDMGTDDYFFGLFYQSSDGSWDASVNPFLNDAKVGDIVTLKTTWAIEYRADDDAENYVSGEMLFEAMIEFEIVK